jgi:hypothetical protein
MACLSMHPGCGPPALEAPPPVSRFALVYRRSGGLKPMPQKLTIRPGRIGSVTVRRDGIRGSDGAATTFKVPARTIRGLRRALGRARFASLPDPGTDPGTCADCYSYEITYRRHAVTFDDVTMPGSLGPIVNRLERIVEAHRPFH